MYQRALLKKLNCDMFYKAGNSEKIYFNDFG